MRYAFSREELIESLLASAMQQMVYAARWPSARVEWEHTARVWYLAAKRTALTVEMYRTLQPWPDSDEWVRWAREAIGDNAEGQVS